MGDHILPQVLLRGFSLNKNASRNKQRIMVYNREKCKTSRISSLYQQDDFYSRDTELHLQREYETPFAVLKKNMENSLLENTPKEFVISKTDLLLLIRFFVVMWRRNDVQLDKAKDILDKIVSNPRMREVMIPKFRNLTTDQMISLNNRKAQHDFYNKVILQTTNEDPTVLKTYRDYIPIIVVNKTCINFPLHNKYASIQYIFSNIEEYPDFTIEPISNRIFMLFILNKKHNQDGDTKALKVISLESISEVELLIRMYVIDSVKSVVVDESNIEIVEDKLKQPKPLKISPSNTTLQNFLIMIGLV